MKESIIKNIMKIMLCSIVYSLILISITCIVFKIFEDINPSKQYSEFCNATNEDGTITLYILENQRGLLGECDIKIMLNDNMIMDTAIGNDGKTCL